jgi:thiol-disulfide isomerase/thioredoxin
MKHLFSISLFVAFTILFLSNTQQVSAQKPVAPKIGPSGIELGNEVGQDLGDFESFSPDSTLLKLSQLRGKMVLVVLWNSLCGHCVTENIKFIKTYEKYLNTKFKNGNGFDVYCIGLDKERATWVEAIDKLGFPWTNNVYVLDSWKDADIRFFGVKNLPGTFLIDGNGIVLSKLFTAEELETTLEKYIEN